LSWNPMELAEWMAQHRQELVRDWIRRAMAAYPAESRVIFERNRDRFANPMPHIISTSLERLFDELLKGIEPTTAAPIMADIVRVKAVQDFTPAQALSFVFELKVVLKEALDRELEKPEILKALWLLERDIDRMAGLAFDAYVGCREKVFEIRVNEIRNQTHMLIRRVNEMDKQNEAR